METVNPVIDDAPLIADRIYVGDLDPTPDHAKCLAEYVRSGNSQELEDELTALRNDVMDADHRADAAENSSEELNEKLTDALSRIQKMEEQVGILQDKLLKAMTALRQTAANMIDFAEKLNPEAIGP